MHARHLIRLLIEHQALKFGQFKTKSGRLSPYFMNFGTIASGKGLNTLGSLYAECILRYFPQKELHLVGPAYKGISLSVAAAMSLSKDFQRSVNITYNRKESKTHGEGGHWIGAPFDTQEGVILIDDVLTGGTSMRQLVTQLRAQNVTIQGAVVGIDRCEKGLGQQSAAAEMRQDFGIQVHSIATIEDVLEWCREHSEAYGVHLDPSFYAHASQYCSQYGVQPNH